MSSTQVIPQIEGLPPGAILKPIQQPAIEGLPAGAILKPIGDTPIAKFTDKGGNTVDVSRNPSAFKDALAKGYIAGPANQQSLEPEPPNPAIGTRFETYSKIGKALGRVKQGADTGMDALLDIPKDVYHAFSDPATQDEKQRQLKSGGDLALDRLVFAQQRAELEKGRTAQTTSERVAHSVAGGLPLIGPFAAHMGEAVGKDPAAALGEGLVYQFAPKIVGESVKEIAGKAPKAIANTPAAVTSKVLGGGEKAMTKAPIKQQTAAGGASNLEVAQYAKSKGIDLLPGQATGSRGLQTLQAVGERAIVAPGDLPDVLEKQKAAFGNAVDDFKARVGTDAIPDTEAAGTSLQSQAHHGLDTLRKSAQADYQAFQEQTGDIPVDLSEVKTKYGKTLADQAEALKNVPAAYANPVKNVLKKLSSIEAGGEVDQAKLATFEQAVKDYGIGPEKAAELRTSMGLPPEGAPAGVKMSTAQQLRSAYLDIARDYSGNVPKNVQRIAGQAAKDIDAAMAKSADSVGATEQWRAANAKWKQLQETYNNPEHPLYKIIQEADPSKVPSKIIGKGNYGGSPQTIRQMQDAGINLEPLKREVAQQIADKNFSLTNGGRGLAGYSTEFLKTLYSPAEFDELTKIGRVGRAIKFEMNPSGTSNVLEGRHQLMGIIHGTVGATVGPVASRITTSQALRRAAMPGVDAAPRSFSQIIQGPPPELTPPPVSGGSTPPTPEPRSLQQILSGHEIKVAPSEATGVTGREPTNNYSGPERRAVGRSDTSKISAYRKELLTETDPAKRAELQASIDREIAFEHGEPSQPIPHENLPSLEDAQRHAREAKPLGEYNRQTKKIEPQRSLTDIVSGKRKKGGK